jgi:cobalt/nickel transport system ATP-binding protein
VTQLLVTHDLLCALEICERSLIIDGGRIVADGATREILGDPQLHAEHRLGLPIGLRIEDLGTS